MKSVKVKLKTLKMPTSEGVVSIVEDSHIVLAYSLQLIATSIILLNIVLKFQLFCIIQTVILYGISQKIQNC